MPRTYCDGIVVAGANVFSKVSHERCRGPYRDGIVVSGVTVLSKVSGERRDGPCFDAVAPSISNFQNLQRDRPPTFFSANASDRK